MTIKTQRLLDRAKKIAKKGDIEEAKHLYSLILEDFPSNQEARNGLLSLNTVKSDNRAPKTELQSVIELFSNGMVREALKAIDVLVKEFPKEPVLFNEKN